jgi:hypothetical protein
VFRNNVRDGTIDWKADVSLKEYHEQISVVANVQADVAAVYMGLNTGTVEDGFHNWETNAAGAVNDAARWHLHHAWTTSDGRV